MKHQPGRLVVAAMSLCLVATWATAQTKAPALNAAEKRVLTYLRQEWGERGRLTTVDQAMRVLGISEEAASRVRLGKYLLQTRTYPRGVGLAKMPATALSATEKRLARHIAGSDPAKRRPLNPSAAAKALGISTRQVEAALRTLLQLGILKPSGKEQSRRYQVASTYRVGFPGANFLVHNASVDSGPPFGLA